MGKKGGKKKGKAKKSGGKKAKGGGGEDQMTLKEAIMALEIQRKEKAVEDLMYEIKGLQEKNKRHLARNERLKGEQELHVKNLLRQAKEADLAEDQREKLTHSDVEKALKELWAFQRSEDAEIRELDAGIENTEEEYQDMSQQVSIWQSYRDFGAKQHADQIELLKLELESMNAKFEEHCAQMQQQLDTSKAEITAEMEQSKEEQQRIASEKAMSMMDQQGIKEIHENEWLKTEAKIHRKDAENLREVVKRLELENIQLISELVDCQVEDLKIHKSFSQGFFKGEDDKNIMDRKALSIYDPNYKSPTGSPARAIMSGKERPKSALLKAIEDKIFSIQTEESSEDEIEEDKEEDDNLEQEEFLHLGPVELKLLCVNGEKKPIHPIDAGIQIVDGSSADQTVTRPVWPVEPSMLRSVQITP